MKKIICLMVGVLTLAGCASTKIQQLSGADFMKQAREIEEINSFHWTSYVGVSGNRAYLEYGQATYDGQGAKTTVYWTELSELPADVAAKLKAGRASAPAFPVTGK